jgi:hypothetical protein
LSKVLILHPVRNKEPSLHVVITTVSNHEDHVWFEDRWMVASLCDE